jgi:hypothetical protein
MMKYMPLNKQWWHLNPEAFGTLHANITCSRYHCGVALNLFLMKIRRKPVETSSGRLTRREQRYRAENYVRGAAFLITSASNGGR